MTKCYLTLIYALAATVSLTAAAGGEIDFNYDDQAAWDNFPGSFCDGSKQSPINIVTANVEEDDDLEDLVFTKWESSRDGDFVNSGHNVQFNPDVKDATLDNHEGTYIVQQFHFHWGEEAGEGSEHRINGNQCELEIHFVTLKNGTAACGSTAADTFSVVAVFGEVDSNLAVTGIWSQLTVPKDHEQEISVSGIKYNDLLPQNRDYYHYEGSLTTPLCNETVQWFVLKHPIQVPGAYLDDLREVEENAQGDFLTFNFRDEQALNGREVATPECDDDGKRSASNGECGDDR